jgi:hypothetical protein
MTTTWIGTTGYHLSKSELNIVRKMARAAGTNWKALAARPTLAQAWLDCYREADNSVPGGLSRVLDRVGNDTMPR